MIEAFDPIRSPSITVLRRLQRSLRDSMESHENYTLVGRGKAYRETGAVMGWNERTVLAWVFVPLTSSQRRMDPGLEPRIDFSTRIRATME